MSLQKSTESPQPVTCHFSQSGKSGIFFPRTVCTQPLASIQEGGTRDEGSSVPRSSRADQPAPSNTDGSEHHGPGCAGSHLCLQHFCRRTGLSGSWRSSFLCHPKPAFLPTRLILLLGHCEEETQEAPGRVGSHPPVLQNSIPLPLMF